MDERASIRPCLPSAKPTAPFWLNPDQCRDEVTGTRGTSASLPERADIVIIGSGITGSSLAFHLLSNPQLPSSSSVVLLEARAACSGATGRNGGHTKCASYMSFMRHVDTRGTEEATKIVDYEYRCMRAMHAFAREHGIQCDSWQGDTVDIFYSEETWKMARLSIEKLREALGADHPAARYRFWNSKETEEKFFVPNALGAVSYEAGSMSGYKLTMGILALALKKGLRLHTETPVTSITRLSNDADGADGHWAVETSRGMIRAKRLVLATNGYTARLYPKLQGTIVPLRGTMTVQRPGTGLPTVLPTTYSFIYSEHGYEYMITRPPGSTGAGDIAIGGCSAKRDDGGIDEFGTTDDAVVDPVIVSLLQESAREYFGSNWGEDHAAGRIKQQWTGIMGFSADGFPLVGPVPDEEGLFIAAAFLGYGMIRCLLAAKALSYMLARHMNSENTDEVTEMKDLLPNSYLITKDRMEKRFIGRLSSNPLHES